MAKAKNAVVDPAFLSAALEGLELQRQRIEEQIRYVKSLLGQKRPGRVAAPQVAVKAKAGVKRALSPAARRRIAAAQKKRWANYRKEKAASDKAGA